MSDQPFDYAGATHRHRRRLFRFSHGRRFEIARELLSIEEGSRFLDYGAGDGHLIRILAPFPRDAALTAFEPLDFLRQQLQRDLADLSFNLVSSTSDLPPAHFDRIACLEVLEHLQPEVLESALRDLQRLLAPDGILVVSVPLEVGFSALCKYAAAMILTGKDRSCTLGEVLRTTLGLPVARDPTLALLPHKGFDHRRLRRAIAGSFRIERQIHSPLPWLGSVLNGQVLWRARKIGSAIVA
ncbi:MAG: class I SAM-dependent methyltransferase [Candidatus Eisenbacteria bacterium]|nr:class I SAM-dependent methyltransferase [Candidatus Eisenbacteria bacterium]